MTTEPPLELVRIAGRIMTKSTHWWLRHGNRSDMYCIHNINLAESCKKCTPEEKGKEGPSQ